IMSQAILRLKSCSESAPTEELHPAAPEPEVVIEPLQEPQEAPEFLPRRLQRQLEKVPAIPLRSVLY
ncbi:MAG: hypothetical protein WCX61_04260, partial [Candidatus Peribacteraceae bacterium]